MMYSDALDPNQELQTRTELEKRFDRAGSISPLRDQVENVACKAGAHVLKELAKQLEERGNIAVIREELQKLNSGLGAIIDFKELRTLRPQ